MHAKMIFSILNTLLIVLVTNTMKTECSNQNHMEKQVKHMKDDAHEITVRDKNNHVFDGVPIYTAEEKVDDEIETNESSRSEQNRNLVTCPWNSSPTSNSRCGCYTKWILYRPDCASEALYWCSNTLFCSGSACGTVGLGSYAYCSQFPLFGFLLLEQYKACGSTSDERSSVGYLGDLQGYKYDPQQDLKIGPGC